MLDRLKELLQGVVKNLLLVSGWLLELYYPGQPSGRYCSRRASIGQWRDA